MGKTQRALSVTSSPKFRGPIPEDSGCEKKRYYEKGGGERARSDDPPSESPSYTRRLTSETVPGRGESKVRNSSFIRTASLNGLISSHYGR